MTAVHFVGFRDDRYWNAVRVWGRPSFIHYVWDRRAQRDVAPGDVVVFAKGHANQPIARYNGPDLFETDEPY
ncbi:MAG: hypothetical protein AAFR88_11990 [Pseudomonadota bacterium]